MSRGPSPLVSSGLKALLEHAVGELYDKIKCVPRHSKVTQLYAVSNRQLEHGGVDTDRLDGESLVGLSNIFS